MRAFAINLGRRGRKGGGGGEEGRGRSRGGERRGEGGGGRGEEGSHFTSCVITAIIRTIMM